MVARRKRNGKKKARTPVRRAIKEDSPMYGLVQDGIAAVKNAHRLYLAEEIRPSFGDSIDLDAAVLQDYPQENRWDYLLGHSSSGEVVGVEPHSAKRDEIATVINKRKAAKQHLSEHLEPGARVAKWIWVASGRVHFADTERARLLLDQNGIEFAGTKALAKHLPVSAPRKSRKRS
jgi:hypothetical protein